MAKTDNSTTIEISIETRDKLHTIQEALKKILRKKQVGADDALRVLLAVKPLDLVLQDMILEDAPVH